VSEANAAPDDRIVSGESGSRGPTVSSEAAAPASLVRALSGWALMLVLLGYALFLHHGLGPFPDRALEIWSPREFLIRQSWITPFEEHLGLGVLAFMLPAALGTVGVFRLSRSSIARMLALSAVVMCGLFAFYGLSERGPGIWNFFHWRGSAVMVGIALVLAATASAPLLATRWLRLPVAARVAVYLPVLLGVVVMMRNVTGTDPTLRFAISPWPVVPLFGLKFGSVAILGVIGGMALAAWSTARDAEGAAKPAARRAVGLVAALLVPALWFKLWHPTFPVKGMVVVTAAGAAFVLGAAFLGRADARGLRSRHLAWGFLLALLPLAIGKTWADLDYSRTREGSARVVIDGLAAYYEDHQEYPEDLQELVDLEYLERIPRPKIGFGFIEAQEFVYQSFGNSYNLEFSSPDWVQCAYNPAWSEEDWDDEEADDPEAAAEAGGEESLGESWSCPSSPPELW